ncbi:hypothetical protein BDN70DRAFT_878592 [Pholiota conissans]|uniref:DUF7918 domain-containing protein n=1 Tax=Pholiota conissans TaxID=109636 RepID=A0A9P5Z544_9AGAR|nr:hypothetical protein BDN70DRAFT_878592 [Pholiota conissans]
MADHLVCEGFEAWVVVGEETLPIFGAEYKEGTREATAWIPSEAGKAFSICYRKIRAPLDTKDFSTRTHLDGRQTSYILHDNCAGTQKISFTEVSPTETRAFMFSYAKLTNDDTYLKNPSANHVGEIKIIYTVVQKLQQDAEPSSSRFIRCSTVDKIHERAKKGLVHQIKYEEIKTRPYYNPRCWRVAQKEEPVTFVLRYRPIGILQAMGISPRTTSPAQTHDDEEENEDADTDAAREQELLAELEKVRSRKRAGRELERAAKRVKTEPIEQNFRRGEVIDLTKENEILDKRVKAEVINLT